ncbi:hypothetical protein BVI1335_20040 [Burkholderia vietnamiensis]|nr:hypothetical protein BVI1335_20040 [Burkholderia vietnamiensis]
MSPRAAAAASPSPYPFSDILAATTTRVRVIPTLRAQPPPQRRTEHSAERLLRVQTER